MSIGVSIIAVIYGLITISWINKQPAGSDKMREISDAIAGKNGLWWPCLLTYWNEMSILYRGPSKDASYQVLIHLAKRFRGEELLQINQSETRIACGGHVC
jgi:hypothetical protein